MQNNQSSDAFWQTEIDKEKKKLQNNPNDIKCIIRSLEKNINVL